MTPKNGIYDILNSYFYTNCLLTTKALLQLSEALMLRHPTIRYYLTVYYITPSTNMYHYRTLHIVLANNGGMLTYP